MQPARSGTFACLVRSLKPRLHRSRRSSSVQPPQRAVSVDLTRAVVDMKQGR